MHTVRVTAFPVRHLTRRDAFDQSKEITWSTGRNTSPGDIQVFAVSDTLGEHRELADDKRRNAVHSIWRALTPVKDEYAEPEWPVQAKFKLLVKLKNPVAKAELVRVGVLKRSWPRNSAGKLLKTDSEINALAEVLAAKNPQQRGDIFDALGLPLGAGRRERSTTNTIEKTFLEGEKRAARATARNPDLRAAAKRHWGLKCYCCGFDFEQFYGSMAKGLAIVHHLRLFPSGGKRRNATVRDVRIVCANCHQVIHITNQPIDVDDLKRQFEESWTRWNEEGVARRK